MSAPDRIVPTLASTTTSLASAIATATAAATASATAISSAGDSHSGAQEGKCELLGPFAIIVQAALGGLALLSLVYKRWRERPQRPIKIWAFDVSKQVVGSVLLHLANLLMSMISSGDLTPSPTTSTGDYQANPCSFYLLNLAIDVRCAYITVATETNANQTTLGIPILILWLKVLTIGASKTPLGNPAESIKSGNYGDPPNVTWWLKQCFIYFIGLIGMKFCVYFIFAICPWIIYAGDWALKWTEGNEQLQIAFVMLLFPLIMNALQYYIIDGFIKNKEPSGGHHALPQEDDDEEDDRDLSRPLRNAWDASFDSEDDDDLKTPVQPKEKKDAGSRTREQVEEYDPEPNGESSRSNSITQSGGYENGDSQRAPPKKPAGL